MNGVEIDPLNSDYFLRQLSLFLNCGGSHTVHFIPADPTVRAMTDQSYRAVLNDGDLNVPDGMGVVWALRFLGRHSERLTGSEAMMTTLRWGQHRDLTHYLFGGKPDVLVALRDRLRVDIPDAQIVGYESPPFRALTDLDVKEAAEKIRRTGARCIWVGLGTPKQDFVAAELKRYHAAPVILCVGAAFDFIAGAKRRSPVWLQRLGLEWFHRLLTEPTRLWRRYLAGNPRFVFGVLKDSVRTRLRNVG